MSGKTVWVAGRLVTRAALGYPLRGHRSTNATFWRHGVDVLHPKELPPIDVGGLRWAYRPYVHRAAVRWVATAGGTYELVGWLTHPWATGVNTGAGVAAVAAGYAYRAHVRGRRTETQLTLTALQSQLRGLLKVEFPQATVAAGNRVSVTLPPRFVVTDSSAKALNELVCRTLGAELDCSWPDLRTSRTVEWSPVPEPPDSVRYAAIVEKMLALPNGQLYIGQDARGRDLVHDLDTDAPHIAMSMPTGKGKSTQFRLLLAQLLAEGDDVTLVDTKRVSLHEFRSSEGIVIVRDTEACWDAIQLFLTEVNHRYAELEKVDVEAWPALLAGWRRKVLVLEELNAFFESSRLHWDNIRTSKDRALPPIFGVLGQILMMARAVRMHVLVASQRFEAKTIGGGANRGQFGLRLLGNPSAADWRMLGEGTRPRGALSRKAGRVAVVLAGESTIAQLGYLTMEEARHHAATYRDVAAVVAPGYTAPDQGITRAPSYDEPTIQTDGITLSDYAKETGDGLAALRAAVQRAGLAPVGTGAHGAKLYTEQSLRNLRAATPSYDPSVIVSDTDDQLP